MHQRAWRGPSVLREAGAKEADLVLATTNMDEVNMLCALTAKRLGAKYTIARIRDVAYTEDLASLQKDLAIDAVINPEYATALEISRLLRLLTAANVDTFFRGKVEMIGVRVREEDPIVGHPCPTCSAGPAPCPSSSPPQAEGRVIIPDGSFVPRPGDKLFVTGTPKDLSIYLRSLGRDLPKVQSAFLIGGSRIAHYLSKCSCPWGWGHPGGERRGALPCRSLSGSPGALVLYGDGTDQELLASEHFANNDAFVALTGRDEDNLISALYAQQQGIPQSGGQVQPDELRCRGPGRLPGCVSGPQAHHRSPHPPAGPGLENKEGSVMSALYRLADTDAEAAEFILQENTPP